MGNRHPLVHDIIFLVRIPLTKRVENIQVAIGKIIYTSYCADFNKKFQPEFFYQNSGHEKSANASAYCIKKEVTENDGEVQ